MRNERSALALLASMLLLAGCGRSVDPIDRWLAGPLHSTYRPPGVAESAALVVAFEAALEGRPVDVSPWGYEALTHADSFALRERAPPSRGWGRYRVRHGDAWPLVLQAPHVGSDRFTGTIATALFHATRARLVAFSSARRDLPGADQANAADAPFARLGEAVAAAGAPWRLLQLHGYGAETARRYDLPEDGLVLSNGTRTIDPGLRALAACWRDAGFDVRLFPEEAAYPGGTRNAVGAALRRGDAQFIHVEMGLALRQGLVRRPHTLHRFSVCLAP